LSRKYIPTDTSSLLDDLNDLVDIVVGNCIPEESFGGRDTLPEVLAYLDSYPKNQEAIRDAIRKLKELDKKVSAMMEKVRIQQRKYELKSGKKL